MSTLPLERQPTLDLGQAQPDDTTASSSWQPSRDWQQLQDHLTEALRVLRSRRGDIDVYWQYHDGEHEQVWLNDALRQAFGGKGMSDLQDNYCAMAVGAFLSRLNVTGWGARRAADAEKPEAKQATAAAAAAWTDNDMELEQDDVHRAAFVAGEADVLVWPRTGPDGQQLRGEPEPLTGEDGQPAGELEGQLLWDVVAKDARNCYVKAGAKRRSRMWAWVVWLERDRWRATGYYSNQDGQPAEVVRLHTQPTRNVSANFPEKAGRFVLDAERPGGPLPEVFGGKCPVVPFKLDRDGRSWLRDVVPLQDKINKLAANKMVAAEFLAFPQRYVLTDQDIPDNVLKYSPAKVLQLDPGGGTDDVTGETLPRTQVGEFSTADLDKYDKASSAEVDKLFTIKLLPRHLRQNPGTPPSGDAVKADEGPHVAFVRDTCQANFGASWADVQELMGHAVQPVWADPEVHNAVAEAQELDYLVRAGVPLLSALRKVGWTPDEIQAVGDELDVLRVVQERAQLAQALAQQQGRPAAELEAEQGEALDKRVTMAGVLIRSGYDPGSVSTALDLPPELVHTGALPTTVRTATEVVADEQAKVEQVDGDVPPPGD